MTSHVKLNPHLVYRDRVTLRAKEYESPGDQWVHWGMGVLGVANIVLCMCFTVILLTKGFELPAYYNGVNQVYHSSILTQSNATMPGNALMPPTGAMDAFTNILLNVDGMPYEIPYENSTAANVFFKYMPHVWLYTKSTATFHLTTVHSQFLVLVALWISAAFGVCSARWESGTMMWQVPIARLVLVHIWNLIGLILVVKLFGYPAGWGEIPLSNFFVAVAAIMVSWAYQYSYMVEIDSKNTKENEKQNVVVVMDEHFSFFKRIMYLEIAVVGPLLMVATILPASEGIEQWRLQTVLFSIYIFFSLTGLIERWIQLTEDSNSDVAYKNNITENRNDYDGNGDPVNFRNEIRLSNFTHMRNAQTYLVYAAAMCWMALVNATMRETVIAVPFYTSWTAFTRQTIWSMYAFMLFVLLSYLVQTVWHLVAKRKGAKYELESKVYYTEILFVFWVTVKAMFFFANLYPDYITIVKTVVA